MPNPGLRLKEPAIAGYAYNPPQAPPFEKEGLCCKPAAYLTEGENYPNRHFSLLLLFGCRRGDPSLSSG